MATRNQGGTKNAGQTMATTNNVPDLAAEAASQAELQLLITSPVGDDATTKALEATQKATLPAHLRLQKQKDDIAA